MANKPIAERIKAEHARHNIRLINLKAQVEEEITKHEHTIKAIRAECGRLTGHKDNGAMFHGFCVYCGEGGA